MPEAWLDALAAAAAAHGQGAAAKAIGYRPSVVSQVLKGSYKGNLSAVRRAVEGAFLGATVDCPVLGDIPAQRCRKIQAGRGTRPSATTPERVKLWRACPACPNASGGPAPDADPGPAPDADPGANPKENETP